VELDNPIQPNQHLPPGNDLQWELWKTMRLRTGVARTRSNMVKWGLNNKEDDKCECAECGERQTDEPTQMYHDSKTVYQGRPSTSKQECHKHSYTLATIQDLTKLPTDYFY